MGPHLGMGLLRGSWRRVRRVASGRGGRRLRPGSEWLERRRLLAIPLSPTDWTDIGPAPILNNLDGNGNVAEAGRITAAAWGKQGLYIAAAGGGVWRTTDLNGNPDPIPTKTHWTPLGQTQPDLGDVPLFIGSLAVIPGGGTGGQDMIFAGTGEPNNSYDSYYGRGLLVSTDGGTTWARYDDDGLLDRRTISKVIAPANDSPAADFGANSVIVAMGPPGANGNTDPSRPNSSGVYVFSLTNGQAKWTPLNNGLPLAVDDPISDIVVDPETGQLYAAIGNADGSANNGVYAFDDETMTWAYSGDFPKGVADGRITLAIGDDLNDLELDGNFPIVYASIAGSNQSNSPGQLVNLMIMRRDRAKFDVNDPHSPAHDGWTVVPMTPAASSDYLGKAGDAQGNYDTALYLPTPVVNPYPLMASGDGDGPYSIMQTQVMIDDKGMPSADWTDLSTDGSGNQPHADHHYLGDGDVIGFSGLPFPTVILDGNDGGLWVTTSNPARPDSPNNWTDLNGDLEITQLNSIALDPTDPNKVYGGSQDNGTEVFSGGRTWQQTDGGDGGVVLVDPRPGQSQTLYHTDDRQPLNPDAHNRQPVDPKTGNPQDNNFLDRSTDGGKTWVQLNTSNQISTTEDSEFYPPMAVAALPPDPANSNAPRLARLVVGTTNLYESTDGGTTWRNLTRFSGNWPQNMTVNSIAISTTNPDTMYVSLVGKTRTVGDVLFTNDNGQTWHTFDVNVNGDGVVIPVGDLAIDPTDDRQLYAVRDQFNSTDTRGHVFHLVVVEDPGVLGGPTFRGLWDDITGNLPDLPTDAVAADFRDGSAVLYVGNDTGVWVSYVAGQWVPLGNQLPHARVTDLQIGHYPTGTVIAAATHGRGVWEIEATPSLSISDVSMDEGNAGTTAFTFTLTLSGPSLVPVTVQVSTTDGTATSPRDFAALNQQVVFPPSTTTETVTVNVVGNPLYEHDETFTVNLSSATGARIAKGMGIGTIVNDDPAPTLTVAALAPVLRPLSGTVDIAFTITIAGATELPATVEYETDDGTATSPDDYTATFGTVTFNPGDTTRTILVPVIGGVQSDPTRTFNFHLDGPIDATIQKGDATGTIEGNAKALDVEPLPPIRPDPRNAPVPEVEVAFSGAVQAGGFGAGALSLTLDGAAVPLAGLTIVPVSATRFDVEGLAPLTSAEGTYTLTVDSGAVRDAGGAAGSGTASVSWLMDTQPPTGAVAPLSPRESSLAFPVAAGGTDPGSGIASFAVYVATDGGPFTFWQDLPASAPSALFPGQSNTTYAFYSVATDLAGNVEAKAPVIEASTYVPDLDPPALRVTTVDTSAPTFAVSWSGTDAGGSGLDAVDLYAAIDGGAPRRFAHLPGGLPSGATYSGTTPYKAIADGSSHTYRFYAIGTDGAGNVEPAPGDPDADVAAAAAFPGAAALRVVSLTVQGGAPGRSFVRYVDINFDETGAALQELIDDHRIRLVQHQLDGMARPTDPTIGLSTATLTAIDHAIEVDFGAGGVGGNPSSTAGDGYYELDLDLDGSGAFAARESFYRLFGDVNGDQAVDLNDLDLIAAALGEVGLDLFADVNGDGTVSALDRALASRSRGRHLAVGLELDG